MVFGQILYKFNFIIQFRETDLYKKKKKTRKRKKSQRKKWRKGQRKGKWVEKKGESETERG